MLMFPQFSAGADRSIIEEQLSQRERSTSHLLDIGASRSGKKKDLTGD